MPAYREESLRRIGRGLDALDRCGRDGLRDCIMADLDGQGRARMFLNMYSYECEAAFYSCYANAWLGLVPRLAAERHLDTFHTSTRSMPALAR